MKKYISLLLCILLCISLIGCSANDNIEENSSTLSVSESTLTTEADSIDVSAADTGDNAESSTSATAAAQKITTAQTAETTKPAAKNSTAAKSTAETTTTASDVTCTVTIECKNILSNMDKLKAGHEAYVPDNGIMLNSCSVTVKNGSTVFDAVEQACGSNGISMNTTTGSYGCYIAGFNNIDEKDCGSASGWLYAVNGSMPNKSCSKYAVKNGDSIVFSYTC